MELKSLNIPENLTVMEDGKPFFFEGSKETGCLLIHGFTGTTSSLKPMGEFLAEKGLTVLAPRLPGHGTDVKDMARWSYQDWTSTAELAFEEISEICDRVFVAGLSMGGTLTLHLAEKFPERVSGLVPISAAVFLKHPLLKLVPILKYILKEFPGVGGDLEDPAAVEIAYEKFSVNAAHEFAKLMKATKKNLSRVTSPARIFVSHVDHAVPVENSPYIYEHISSKDKELIMLDNSYHVATLDNDKEKIFRMTYEFISGI